MPANNTSTPGQSAEPHSTTVDSSNWSLESFADFHVSETLLKVVPPFIMVCGTFGNVMTMLVMRAKKAGTDREQTVSLYFTSLAACDLTVLWVGLSRHWVRAVFHWDVRNSHVAVCKVHKFLVYAVSRMSSWLLVALTTQRALTILWPLKRVLMGTKKTTLVVVLTIFALCVITDLGTLINYTHVKTRYGAVCKLSRENEIVVYYVDKVSPWLSTTLSSLLPLFMLVVNNSILGWKVQQSVRTSRAMTTTGQGGEQREKAATSLSITLFLTSTAFLLLTAPVPATFLLKKFSLTSSSLAMQASMELVDTLLDLLWYCNSAVNFYLYCLSGTKFRTEALNLLACRGEGRQSEKQTIQRQTHAYPSCLTARPQDCSRY